MRRRRLLLSLLLAALVVGAVFVSRGWWLAQLTGGVSGDTQADGYLVQLTEPPLLARENVAQKYRALALADRQRRVLKANTVGGETSAEAATIQSLDLKIANGTKTLQAIVEPERVTLTAQQRSVRARVNALLASGGVLSTSVQGWVETRDSYSMAFNGFYLPVRRLTAAQIAGIESVPGVKKVFPNSLIRASLDTSVPAINAPSVWGLNTSGGTCISGSDDCMTGKGVKIGIMDTGVDYTHADLGGCTAPGGSCKVRWGYNYVMYPKNGVLVPADDPDDPMDDNGHGTHVAATAAGKSTNGSGFNGVAPGAEIYAFKVLDANGGGNTNYVAGAINEILGGSTYTTPMVDIVNMSFDSCASHDPDGYVSNMVEIMVSAGINVVVAAGNSHTTECPDVLVTEPGAAQTVITVGGSNDNGAWQPSYSRYGPVPYGTGALVKPDVLAPGTICAAKSRLSSFNTYCSDTSHVSLFGTSMATPHVTGVAALMLQAHPEMTPDVLKQTLRDSTFGSQNFNPSNLGTSGYGMVDALAAAFASPHQPVHLTALGADQNGYVWSNGITLRSNIGDISGCESYRVLLAASDGSGCQQGIILSQANVCQSGLLLSLEPDTFWKNNVYFFIVLEVTDQSGQVSRDALALITSKSFNSSVPSCLSFSSSSRSSSLSSSSSPASSSSSSVASSSSSAASSSLSSSSHSSSSLPSSSSHPASSSQSSWITCPTGYQCTRTQSNQGGVLQCLASSLASCTPEWNGSYCGSPSCLGECYRCASSSSTPSSSLSSSHSSSRSSVASSGPHTCGNGIVEPTERCDDGDRTSGDGCSSTCQAECIDTDGGPDYSVRGTTKSTWRSDPSAPLRWTSRTDVCQGNVLTEFLCSTGPGTQNAIAGRAVTCKRGCNSGACAR